MDINLLITCVRSRNRRSSHHFLVVCSDFYPDGIIFGDRPEVANFFVGAVPSGTRHPKSLYLHSSSGGLVGHGATVFPPSLRRPQPSPQGSTDQPAEPDQKTPSVSFHVDYPMPATDSATLGRDPKLDNKKGPDKPGTSISEEHRMSNAYLVSSGAVPTISYIFGTKIHQLQIWRPVIQVSRKNIELLSRVMSSFPLLRAQHLQVSHHTTGYTLYSNSTGISFNQFQAY